MEELTICPECGQKSVFHNVNKISQKTGKPYTNWNCSNPDCKYIKFEDTNLKAAKEIDQAKNMGMPEVLNPKWQGFFDKVDEIAEDVKEIRNNTEK